MSIFESNFSKTIVPEETAQIGIFIFARSDLRMSRELPRTGSTGQPSPYMLARLDKTLAFPESLKSKPEDLPPKTHLRFHPVHPACSAQSQYPKPGKSSNLSFLVTRVQAQYPASICNLTGPVLTIHVNCSKSIHPLFLDACPHSHFCSRDSYAVIWLPLSSFLLPSFFFCLCSSEMVLRY